MAWAFKGWIPTVSGRLSFSEIGDTRTPTTSVVANVADASGRYLICFQGRDLSDALYPDIFRDFLNDYLHKRQGKFWFVLVAQTDEIDKYGLERLTGKIFIFAEKKAWKKSRFEKIYQRAHNIISENFYPSKRQKIEVPRIRDMCKNAQKELISFSNEWRKKVCLKNLVLLLRI